MFKTRKLPVCLQQYNIIQPERDRKFDNILEAPLPLRFRSGLRALELQPAFVRILNPSYNILISNNL